jgi:hypothetical protein
MVNRDLLSVHHSIDMLDCHQYMVRTPVVIARRNQPQRHSYERERDLDDEQLGVEL